MIDDASAAQTRKAQEWRWGVTVDDITKADQVVDALAHLPARPTARIVFDQPMPASYYVNAAKEIHRVADVVGELVDSQFMKRFSVASYRARTREYLSALGANVDLWEVGNEINGEWLGDDVMAKVSAAYEEVKAAGRPAALTLHYNEGCAGAPTPEMFSWTEANVPLAMRLGVDVVLISYYEDDCQGRRPNWATVFDRLGRLFPNAGLGFGECGTFRAEAKAEFVRRYYAIKLAEPRFIGGFFWWMFAEDMVPRSRPLWSVLADAMTSR
jgi:hypothetical protein